MKTVASACMAVCLAGMVGGCIMAPYQTYPAYQVYQAPATPTAVYPATPPYSVGENAPPATVVPAPVPAPTYYYYAEPPPPAYVWPWFPGVYLDVWGGRWHGRGWR